MAYDVQWLRDWRERTGLTLQEAMAAHAAALRASDERPLGRDLQGLGGDSPASAITEGEAPDTIDNLKRVNKELREALRPFAEEAAEIPEGFHDDEPYQSVRIGDLRRARTLLSQSSEGEG
ncbi:hypothetical protein FF100_05065 [Methylobacterium terricola]|uniref:Uncharacterized protein n=1 Tax=Methylobacterium terricola TaxID=2583531 RepID=A0A5C4LKC1_9HYPH|nr:hypothetical protein [Methylobacterium terricola]TNC14947.1 hypothetical protein FF100_05065 [Methylobacterium terricola]